MSQPSPLTRIVLPVLALTAGVLGMCAIWTTAAVLTQSTQAWLALLAGLDMAVLLRLTGMPAGRKRAGYAVVATALACLASYWMIAATQFGGALGLRPLESAARLGPRLAWELTRLAAGPFDPVFIAAGLALAGVWAYGQPRRR